MPDAVTFQVLHGGTVGHEPPEAQSWNFQHHVTAGCPPIGAGIGSGLAVPAGKRLRLHPASRIIRDRSMEDRPSQQDAPGDETCGREPVEQSPKESRWTFHLS